MIPVLFVKGGAVMKRHELIEALMKFSEQTGVDWYEWEEWIDTENELCVVFKIEGSEDE